MYTRTCIIYIHTFTLQIKMKLHCHSIIYPSHHPSRARAVIYQHINARTRCQVVTIQRDRLASGSQPETEVERSHLLMSLRDHVIRAGFFLGRSEADMEPAMSILNRYRDDSVDTFLGATVKELFAVGLPWRFAKRLDCGRQQSKGRGRLSPQAS